MPPKIQFSRDEIIEAAFAIAKDEGFSGITARSVAKRLKSSVAPIYVNFQTIEELIQAVVQRVFALSRELLDQQTGEHFFENIGRASLSFAREYPVLFRELVLTPNPYLASRRVITEEMVDALEQQPEMSSLSAPQRRRLLLKMQVFQTGLSAMVANGHLPEECTQDEIEELLMETGEELLYAQKHIRKENER